MNLENKSRQTMNILLIGHMGAGKSTIGSLLAKELDYDFIETDPLILNNTGLTKVNEVYEYRPTLWKESELEVMKKLSYGNKQVIACSGGVAENHLNFLYFEETETEYHVIYLEADNETLAERIASLSNKVKNSDLFFIKKNVEILAKKRNDLYEKYADIVINTSTDSPTKLIGLIKQKLKLD